VLLPVDVVSPTHTSHNIPSKVFGKNVIHPGLHLSGPEEDGSFIQVSTTVFQLDPAYNYSRAFAFSCPVDCQPYCS